MTKGVLLAFLTYALFSTADAAVKGLGGMMPVTEIVFLVTLSQFLVILLLRPPGERWRDILRMNHPKWVMLRAFCGATSAICSTYAFTTVPLAEAYALIFLAPVIVTILSIFILGERVGWRRLLAVAVGFAGMLLVVKPGFRELHPGHFVAVVVAVVAAFSVIVLRKIGRTERQVSLLGMVMLACIVSSGILALPVMIVPPLAAAPHLLISGIAGGIAQITYLAAMRAAPANRVAPAQYSQIFWAVALGAIFYAEVPDAVALGGIALIALSGLFTFLREDKVTSWPRRTWPMRDPI
jgi:drug/metabolite transporter (DMT)-like permease